MSQGDQEKNMAASSDDDGLGYPTTAEGFLSFMFSSEGIRLTTEALNHILSKDSNGYSLLDDLLSMEEDYSSFEIEPILDIKEEDEFESHLASLAPVEIDEQCFDDFNFEAVLEHISDCSNQHERTDDERVSDILYIVHIGLLRGNIRHDQVEKTFSVGAERIKQLADWYKIPIRSAVGETIPLQTGTLTFVRALIFFPHVASNLLYTSDELAKNGAKTVLVSEQLPVAMKHCGFPGLIPKRCDAYLMKAYLFAHVAYMVDFGNLINPGDQRTLKEISLTQLSYCKLIVENEKSIYTDEFRVGQLQAVGLTDPAVFKIIVDVCNNLCKVVGEPELSFETAEKNHIKNNMICFFEDDSKDVSADEQAKDVAADEREKDLADKLEDTSINDLDDKLKVSTSKN